MTPRRSGAPGRAQLAELGLPRGDVRPLVEVVTTPTQDQSPEPAGNSQCAHLLWPDDGWDQFISSGGAQTVRHGTAETRVEEDRRAEHVAARVELLASGLFR